MQQSQVLERMLGNCGCVHEWRDGLPDFPVGLGKDTAQTVILILFLSSIIPSLPLEGVTCILTLVNTHLVVHCGICLLG